MKNNVDRDNIHILNLLPNDESKEASNSKNVSHSSIGPIRQLEAVIEELEVYKLLTNFVNGRIRMMNSQTIFQSMNNIGKCLKLRILFLST